MTPIFRKLLISVVIGLLAAIIFGCLSCYRLDFLEKFENSTFDLKMTAARKYHPEIKPANRDVPVFFMDIDDNSLFNREFPLPRSEYARAIDVLREAGAKVIGFDLIFPEVAPKHVSSELFNELHQNVEDIMTSSKILPEDKEYEIHDKIDIVYEYDVDDELAKSARKHGHICFPLAFRTETVVPNQIEFKQLSVKAKEDARKLFFQMSEDNDLILRWLGLRTDKDKIDQIQSIILSNDDLRNVAVSPLLNLEIDNVLTENIVNVLKEGSGLDLSNIKAIAEHFDSEGREGFDLIFQDKMKVSEKQLEVAYARILDDQIYKDIIANYEDAEVRNQLRTALKLDHETTVKDIADYYYDTILYDNFSSKWVRAFSITGDFPKVEDMLKQYVLLRFGTEISGLAERLPFSYGGQIPILPYLHAQPHASFIQIEADADGVVRNWPLLRAYEGQIEQFRDKPVIFPMMSLQLLLDYLDVPLSKVEIDLGNELRIPTNDGEIYTVPIDDQGRMILDWISGNFKEVLSHVSFKILLEASDVKRNTSLDEEKRKNDYEDKVAEIKKLVEGKIVLIGLSATGSHDMNPTSLSPRFPMVSAHGNCIANIMCGTAIRRISPVSDFLLTAIILILFCIVLTFLPYLYSTILTVTAIVGYAIASYYLQLNGIWVNTFYVQSGLIGCSVSMFAAKYAIEGRSRAMLKKIFSTYLSPKLVEQMADKLPTLKLGGESMEATVYFSDIEGFTSLSEKLEPQALVELLNRYLTLMTDNILENEGLLDKYIGDAIVAAFGVPFPDEQHAKYACTSAILNNASIADLNKVLQEEGKPVINQRIGICSGPLVAGNMGSERRLAYTVMGDTVNLGSRMENANKYYGTKIMISASTHSRIDDEFFCRRLDRLKVVGKQEPVDVFELVDFSRNISPETANGYKLFEEALQMYFSMEWKKAIEMFEQVKIFAW